MSRIEPLKAIVEIQIGMNGHAYQFAGSFSQGGIGTAGLDAISGGGQTRSIIYTRDFSRQPGAIRAVGAIRSGERADLTTTLSVRAHVGERLREYVRRGSMMNIRVRYNGQATDRTSFDSALLLAKAVLTTQNMSGAAAQTVDALKGAESDLLLQFGVTAADLWELLPVKHTDISKTALKPINKMINVGEERAATFTDEDSRGDTDFVAVSDFVTGTETPILYWTRDGWDTVNSVNINGAADENALDVALLGNLLLVVTKGAGGANVMTASLQDIYDGVATPFTAATGVDQTNLPNAIHIAGDGTVYLANDAGYIQTSQGGQSYSTLLAGTLTTENLVAVHSGDSNLIWFAGENGALVRYKNETFSSVTVTGLTTETILSVAAPTGRSHQVFLGLNDGTIHRSLDEGDSWDTIAFAGSGSGTVPDLQFGADNEILWIIHTDGSGDSLVIRDNSGGNGGQDAQPVSSRSTPDNNGFNSIATVPSDPNMAFVGGELINALAFIGSIDD